MEWTTVEIPFGGVDAFTDAVHVKPGRMALIVNGRFTSPPGISKRPGFRELTRLTNNGVGSITLGTRIDWRPADLGERLLFTDRQLFAYSEALERWELKGIAGDTLIKRAPVYYDQGQDLQACTVAINGGFILSVWGIGEFTASVKDLFGTVVATSTEDFAPDARTFALGDYLYAVSLQGAAPATFKVTRMLANGATSASIPASGNFSPSIDVGNDEQAGRLWDAREMERPVGQPTRRFVHVYKHFTAEPSAHIRVDCWNDSIPPTRVWGPIDIAENPGNLLTRWGHEDEAVYVAWDSGNAVRVAVLDSATGAVTAGPSQINTAVPSTSIARGSFLRHSSTQVLFVWELQKENMAVPPPPPSGHLPSLRWRRVSNGAAGVGDDKFLYDCALLTRPWMANSRYYVGACFHEAEQSAGFVIEVGNTIDGQLAPRWTATFGRLTTSAALNELAENDPFPWYVNVISNVHEYLPNTNVWSFGSLHKHKFTKARERSSDGKELDEIRFHRGMHLTSVEFDNRDRFQSVSWDRGYFVAGGKPGWYDGFALTEHGFAWYPSYDRDKSSAATDDIGDLAGGQLDIGAYQVCAIYEHEDTNGMLTRSGVSRIMSHDLAADNRQLIIARKTTLMSDRIPAADAWWAQGFTRPREIYYRTLLDGTDFLRAEDYAGASMLTDPIAGLDHPLGENTGEADAAIAEHGQLYTTGDILPNDGTPSCRLACVNAERLWIGGLENAREMWFSQPFVTTETPRFNAALRLLFSTDILNARSLDDKLVCFSIDRIYTVIGPGPSAAGGLDVGFEIQLVTSDIGLLDLRSLVETPLGLMFRSTKGIYLLDRALGLKFVGREAKNLIDDGSTCVGAVVNRTTNEVYFCFTPDEELNSYNVVYNYLLDVWYSDSLNFRAASIAMFPTAFEECIAILKENGVVYEMTSSSVTDPAIDGDLDAFIPLITETGWIKPSDLLQGWSEIGEMLILVSLPPDVDCQMQINVYYDYDTSETPGTYDPFPFTEAELQALVDASGFAQLSVTPSRRQVQAFKVTIFDSDSGDGPDVGYSLKSIVVDVGNPGGVARVRREARH